MKFLRLYYLLNPKKDKAMKDKVQIIEFKQEPSFPLNYIMVTLGNTGLSFVKFRLSEIRTGNIARIKAKYGPEYYTGKRWKHITGMIPVKGYQNWFYGDIQNNTVAIWLHPEKVIIKMAIFHGHNPKTHGAREKKVIQFILSCIKKTNG